MQSTRLLIPVCLLLAGCPPPYASVPPAPPMSFLNAEDALRRGDFEVAAVGFATYLAGSSDRTYRARAYYQLAQAQYGLHRYEETLEALNELEAQFPRDRWPQTAALRGDAQYALGHRTDAMLAWEEAWARGNDRDREVLRARLERTAGELSERELRDLGEMLTIPAVRLILESHSSSRTTGFDTRSVDPLKNGRSGERLEFEGAGRKPDEAKADEAPRAPSPETKVRGRVACLLPLTGPDKTYGRRALSGLRVAFADAPEALIVRDTGGDPTEALPLLEELAADPTIIAVIGPLRSSEAAALVPAADRLKIPLLLLSLRDGFTGRYALQVAITQRQQVRAILAHARQDLHLIRFAVFHPDNEYGRSFTSLFADEVQRQGGTVVGTQTYGVDQHTFATEAAALRAWQRHGDVQAVFIPDAATAATAVAAAVRHVVPNVVLLGSESWNDARAMAQAGAAVEGAIFADAFYAGSAVPSTARFVERFRTYAGHSPTVFEAQAFDAAMLVRRAMEAGAATRDAVVDGLRAMGPYEGAGRVRVADGGLERDLFLLRVRNGQIEEVRGATSG